MQLHIRERLWRTIMERIHADLPARSFERPAGIISVSVCRDSGLPPTELCHVDPRGSRVITELFAQGLVPSGTCHLHQQIVICTVSGLHPGLLCHPNHIAYHVGLMLEPLPDFASNSTIPGRAYAFTLGLLNGRECSYCDGTYQCQYEYDYPEYPYDYGDWTFPSGFDDWPWNIPSHPFDNGNYNPYAPDQTPPTYANYPSNDGYPDGNINSAPEQHPADIPPDEPDQYYNYQDANGIGG